MIGIDAKIERVRVLFEQGLFLDYSYDSYGRAFLNDRDEQTVPEILIDGSHEYKEVLLNDNVGATSFFVVQNDYTVDNKTLTGTVNIYFSAKLSTIYPAVTERAVEYLHRDVLNILDTESFEVTGITSGKDAFSDFDIRLGDNMQPFYLVKFTTTTSWGVNECVKIPNDARITEDGNFRITEQGTLRIVE